MNFIQPFSGTTNLFNRSYLYCELYCPGIHE